MLTLFVASWLLVGTLQTNQPTASSLAKASDTDQAIDIRGIWKGKKLDAKKARARGLDPAAIETPVKTVK
jgi:hypothetical protein